jgi:hypothetical protein
METIKVPKKEIMMVMITMLGVAQQQIDDMRKIYEHEDIAPAFNENGDGERFGTMLNRSDYNLKDFEALLREEYGR